MRDRLRREKHDASCDTFDGRLAEQAVAGLIFSRHLTLLPLSQERVEQDADEMATVLADPTLYKFTGGSPPTSQALRSRYERQIAGPPDPAERWYNWLIELRDERRLVGFVQATVWPAERSAEVAWVVGTPWQRRGIAKEAALAVIGWLNRHSVQTVIAHIHPSNTASASVAAACGLAPTEHMQDGEIRWCLDLPTHVEAGP